MSYSLMFQNVVFCNLCLKGGHTKITGILNMKIEIIIKLFNESKHQKSTPYVT